MEIEEIKKIVLNPNDVLFVKAGDHVDGNNMALMARQMRSIFTDNKVIISKARDVLEIGKIEVMK